MARRPQGTVRRRPLPFGKQQLGIGKPQPTKKRKGRPKPGSKPKGPAGGPRPGSKPKPSVPRMPVTQKAMGGQASEGAAKSALLKRQKTARQKEMMDMLRRLYGKQIVPKKKPKKSK